MLNQEIAESSDSVSIGNLIARFYAAKIRKGATVHNLVAGPLVGQRIQILQKMNPEHQFQVIGFISALPLIVARSPFFTPLPTAFFRSLSLAFF